MLRVQAYRIIFSSLGFVRGICFIFFNNMKVVAGFKARFGDHTLLVRSNTNDLFIVYSVLCGDEYSDVDPEILRGKQKGLIVDAGAHIGASVLKLRSLFPLNEIVAIEPQEANYRLLRENLSFQTNVTIINSALVPSAFEGKDTCLRDRTGRAGFTIVEEPQDNPLAPVVQKVSTISLKEILNDYDNEEISFLKVDVEGAERMIFSSDKELAPLIFMAYVELHDRIVDGCTETVKSFFKNTHKEFPCKGEKVLFVRKNLSLLRK